MKTRIITLTISLFLAFLFISCDTIPVSNSSTESWIMPNNAKSKAKTWGTMQLAGVSVDRSGGWDSLEKEVTALAPLYFWKQGCRLAGPDEAADYTVRISLREREYSLGWRTRRSLAVEVMVWAGAGASTDASLPLAAGRVVAIGNKSFASSKTTSEMLSGAIEKTTKKLSAARKGK